MSRVNLQPTIELHERLSKCWSDDPASLVRVLEQEKERLHQHQLNMEGKKSLTGGITAFLLDPPSQQTLRHISERLFTLVEQVLQWLLDDPKRLEQYFPNHRRVFPYLCKTAGLDTWQGYARYDLIVAPDGQLKVIELNTACPAGWMFSNRFSHASWPGLTDLGLTDQINVTDISTLGDEVMFNQLMEVEAASGIEPGLIALANDENGLTLELDLFEKLCTSHNRQAAIVNAADLQMREGRVVWKGTPVSITYNKMRVSTAGSPNHCWKAGFEKRYATFLQGMSEGTIASMNNLVGLSIAEDKSLLGVMLDPEILALFEEEDQQFLQEHILPTAPLTSEPVNWEGEQVDLASLVKKHPEQFVIKPANEGRGFGVVVGSCATSEEWQEALQPCDLVPKVVQAYQEPARLPVVLPNEGQLEIRDRFITLALFITRGKHQGVLSRISANPVTNVARHGTVQAVHHIE